MHRAAAQLVNFFNSTNRSGCVITLNIDGFDRKMSLGEEVYEFNGNLDFTVVSCATGTFILVFSTQRNR